MLRHYLALESDQPKNSYHKLENDRAFLPGVVSRKKQIVPQLTEAFEK